MEKEKIQWITQKYKESWDYYEQLYANNIDNLELMDKSLEKCNLPKVNHEKKRKYEQTNHKHKNLKYGKISSNKQKPRARWLHRQILPKV